MNPVSQSVHGQLQKIDQQILDLLGQRIVLCQQAVEEDEAALSSVHQTEVLEEWQLAAEENGWNMGETVRMCRGMLGVCRSAVE